MKSLTEFLTPAQIDTMLSVYDTVADWYVRTVDFVVTHASNIVTEDVYM